jgi:zinc finger HIT domain-containing protein 1
VGTWGKGRKMTTNVRRILLSEKNFSHYLDDEEAKLALARETAAGRVEGRRSDSGIKKSDKGSVKRARISAKADEDVEMADAASAEQMSTAQQQVAAKDAADDPLLKVSTPAQLSPDELEDLLSQPPLSYNAARAAPPEIDGPPQRKFCEMCGYWGRVKCLKCGSRVCGLDCKEAHDQDCRKRFA